MTLFLLIFGAFWVGMVGMDLICSAAHGDTYPLGSSLVMLGISGFLLGWGVWRWTATPPAGEGKGH